jgi:hypothetical protein
MRSLFISPLCAAALLVGCAHEGTPEAKASKITDEDMGRLLPEEEAHVTHAKDAVTQAEERLAHKKLELQKEQTELDAARADVKAAEAQLAKATATEKAAHLSGSKFEMEKAVKERDRGDALKRAADARVLYVQERIDAEKAQVAAGQEEVSVADARFEYAKLRGLQQANHAVARKYDAGKFESAINSRQMKLEQLEKKARQLEKTAMNQKQVWQLTEQELEKVRQ